MKRRHFLRIATLAPVAAAAANPAAEPLPPVIGPYLQHPSPGVMTVMLLTKGDGEVALEVNRGGERTVEGTAIPGCEWTVWKSRIEGLRPGAEVDYRVRWKQDGAERFASPVHRFRVPDATAETSRFLVFNDVHDHLETLAALLEHVDDGDHDFTCLLGDIWNDPSPRNGAEVVFRTLDALVRGLDAASKPFFYIRGNHELRGGFKDRLAWLFDIPALDPAAKFDEQNWWHSHRIGPFFLIATDTGEDDGFHTPKDSYKRPEFWQGYRKRQVPWLEKLVGEKAAGDAPWTVFLGHIPLFDPASWHSDPSREFWRPVLTRTRIDLMLAGHDHSWKFVPENKPFELKKTDAEGNPTVESFTPEWPILIGGGPSIREGTVMKVKADRRGLSVDLVHTSGKVLHEVRMKA
ncbi:MAG: metallophosphoesterase [Akkermansiaceae bacterium]|nr:metallophosphoesterase [Akkermansiaceae bacterium]MCP5544734.1 metallophosphoesterase [Akkermansiaceae bacterium]MCP5545874.1 metallophosphoesterase [Akkermansiaceae bacterium]